MGLCVGESSVGVEQVLRAGMVIIEAYREFTCGFDDDGGYPPEFLAQALGLCFTEITYRVEVFWNQRVRERLIAVRATQTESASKSAKGK